MMEASKLQPREPFMRLLSALTIFLITLAPPLQAQEPAKKGDMMKQVPQGDGEAEKNDDADEGAEDKGDKDKDGEKEKEENFAEMKLSDLKDLLLLELAKLQKFKADKPPKNLKKVADRYRRILMSFADRGTKEAAFFLRKHLADRVSHPETQLQVTASIRSAIGAMKDDSKGFAVLVRLMKAARTDWKDQVDLAYAMRLHEGPSPDKALLSMLRDKRIEVSGAAMRALAFRRYVPTVPKLLTILGKKERSRERRWLDARQSLTAITGFDFSTHRAWKEKWKEIRKSFDPEKSRGSERLFFPRNEIVSQRVVFIFDTSASMHVRDTFAPPGSVPKITKGTCRYCKRNHAGVDEPIERERLFRGRDFMKAMLKTMGKGGKFNLVHFNDRAFSWQLSGQLARVDDGAITVAIDYLENYKPQGLSYAYGGFKTAFKHSDVDTMFYVSDGIASSREGGRVDFKPLLAKIKNLNRHRGVRIFSIGFRGSPKEFMKKLARQNGGSYVEID